MNRIKTLFYLKIVMYVQLAHVFECFKFWSKFDVCSLLLEETAANDGTIFVMQKVTDSYNYNYCKDASLVFVSVSPSLSVGESK